MAGIVASAAASGEGDWAVVWSVGERDRIFSVAAAGPEGGVRRVGDVVFGGFIPVGGTGGPAATLAGCGRQLRRKDQFDSIASAGAETPASSAAGTKVLSAFLLGVRGGEPLAPGAMPSASLSRRSALVGYIVRS